MSLLKFKEQPAADVSDIQKKLLTYASSSWMAVASLEGYENFSELSASGRIKSEAYFVHDDIRISCWRCNGLISHDSNQGMAAPYKAGAKFNDHWECRGKHNSKPVVCAACEALAHAAYHPNFKLNALYTGDRAYQLTLDEDLISFLLDPPQPPYLFVMGENNSQHMVWLSDYTLDGDLISIQKARGRYLVSRKAAFDLAIKFKELLDLTNEIRLRNKQIELSTPLSSSRKEINTRSGNNLQISQSIVYAGHDQKLDTEETKSTRQRIRDTLQNVEFQAYSYGTWYVATMLLKALVTGFSPKAKSSWQQIKQPLLKSKIKSK